MRKIIFFTNALVVLGIGFALIGSVPVRASPDFQARQAGLAGPSVYMPLVYKTAVAVLFGKVVDASDGLGVSGAQVCYQSLCTFSSSNGDYTLGGLPSGVLLITVTKLDYLELTEAVATELGTVVYHQFVITKSTLTLGNAFIRAIVTWSAADHITTPLGTYENDLDAHMWFDNGALALHLYSGSGEGTNECNVAPNMCLLVDRRLGSGPETIDVSQLEASAHYWFGVFNVNYVYDPTHYPTFSQLNTIVRLNDDTGFQQSFTPPSGNYEFWFLFEMNDAGVVTIKNCLTNYPGDDVPTCPDP